MSRNRFPLTLALVLGAAACAAPATPALADPAAGPVTVVVAESCSKSYGCDPQLEVAAATDAPIDVTIRDAGADMVITSAGGAWLSSRRRSSAGTSPCSVVDARSVACPASTPVRKLAGGPGADRFDLSGTTVRGLAPAGGAGDDTLIGGPGGAALEGGPGRDTLVGGVNGAYADLGDHRAALRVDLRTQSVTGGDPGSLDTLRGITSVTGGHGDDVLIGTAGRNGLDGGDGADTLIGGDGDDVLTGGRGADLLVGEGGDDALDGLGEEQEDRRSPDRFDCGSGRDQASGASGDTVAITCERLEPGTTDEWRLAAASGDRSARVLVPRGVAPDFDADYRIEVRDTRGRVRRTIRKRVDTAVRRRSPFFSVPVTRSVVRLRVNIRTYGDFERPTWTHDEFRIVLR